MCVFVCDVSACYVCGVGNEDLLINLANFQITLILEFRSFSPIGQLPSIIVSIDAMVSMLTVYINSGVVVQLRTAVYTSPGLTIA